MMDRFPQCSPDPEAVCTARMFRVAWIWFAVAAGFGVLLRLQFVAPLGWGQYGHLLHTHSHIAFLGWVFNAYYALAVLVFAPSGTVRSYARLFAVTQVTVLGVLVAFPLQGYGRESIVFSSLHMVCAAVFLVRLLRRNRAVPAARPWLWAAGGFFLVSALGPLAFAPIRVLGLDERVWGEVAVAFYLHFQYNGWFVFFPVAVLWQVWEPKGERARHARRALAWLAAGCIPTFGLSLFPLDPPAWVVVAAGAGGAAQLVGCFYAIRALRGVAGAVFHRAGGRLVAGLGVVAVAFFLFKSVLQAAAVIPGLAELAMGHLMVIAFMHVVFLGVVTPVMLASAVDRGWMSPGPAFGIGLTLFAAGAAVKIGALAYTAVAPWIGAPTWPAFAHTQLGAAVALFVGTLVMMGSMGGQPRAAGDAFRH